MALMRRAVSYRNHHHHLLCLWRKKKKSYLLLTESCATPGYYRPLNSSPVTTTTTHPASLSSSSSSPSSSSASASSTTTSRSFSSGHYHPRPFSPISSASLSFLHRPWSFIGRRPALGFSGSCAQRNSISTHVTATSTQHSSNSTHCNFSQQRTLFTTTAALANFAFAKKRTVYYAPSFVKGVSKNQIFEKGEVNFDDCGCFTMATVSSSHHEGGRVSVVEGEGGGSVVPELAPDDQLMRKNLHEIFLTAVEAVMPRSLLEKVIHFNPHIDTLTVKGRSYIVQRNVFVVGFGKGVLGMARVVEELLGDHIIKGILSIPTGARQDYMNAGKQDMLLREGSKIMVQEGAANNLPDTQAFRTARDIHHLVSNLTHKDIVIVLMSGGGSALLPYPIPPLSLEDVVSTTQALFAHGGSIGAVNTVRRHLEVLKGGGLAKAAMPAQVVSLIISDVIGDSLELIASGPTVRQTQCPYRCLELIDSLNARHAVPKSVLDFLQEGKDRMKRQSQLTAQLRGGHEEDCDTDPTDWNRVQNVVVGSNAVGCGAALTCAEQLGYIACVFTHTLSGEARNAGRLLASLAQYTSACYLGRGRSGDRSLVHLELELAAQGIDKDKLNEIAKNAITAHNSKRPLCLVAGGETTVNVTGTGKGGRNQELVLAAGLQLQSGFEVFTQRKPSAQVFFLSAGTDGQDGPTDAAGAMVDENFAVDAMTQGLEPQRFLDNNDAYNLWAQFAGGRDHLVTGLTGTNVMDIHLLVINQAW